MEGDVAYMAAMNLGPDSRPSATAGLNLTGFWRLYEIHRLISQGTLPNCPGLAELLEVNQRTIERDIERLRDMFGAPVEYDRARRGYRYTGTFELPLMKLREGEAIALFLGQKLLMQCRGTPFEDFVRMAMTKIRVLLPQSIEVNVERLLGSVSFHAEPLRGEEAEVAERYQLIARAIENQKTVETDYYTASRQALTHRKIDPYHLRLTDGAWYCIGFCHERREVRTFALDRMLGLQVTADSFSLPAGFSVDEYLADSWTIERGEPHKVVIEFDKTENPYIRGRQWHRSQVLEELPDDTLRMTLTIGGLGEVMRWVMSLGSHAWVVEPDELRRQVATEHEAARRRYSVSQ